MSNHTSPIIVQNYIVAYLDVLGQKELLKDFPKILLDNTDLSPILKQMQNTYGKVYKVRTLIKSFFEGMESVPNYNCDLQGNDQSIFQQMACTPIHQKYFGDSFIAYAKLINPAGALSTRAIYAIITQIAINMTIALANKVAVRGGIEIGIAADWEEFGIYGSALYGAYHLESQIADYPRIVVGPELIKYLRSSQNNKSADPISRFNEVIAGYCFKLIGTDGDGVNFVDFLNSNLPSVVSPTHGLFPINKYKQFICDGFTFVTAEYNHFKTEGKNDLAQRYERLCNYYKAKMPGWGIEL